MVFEENFLRLTEQYVFKKKKNEWFNNVNFLIFFFQSTGYDNVVVTKQIYFLSVFLKSWIFKNISDSIAGIVRDSKYYYRRYRYREGERVFLPCPLII